jgi:hypothetical protein
MKSTLSKQSPRSGISPTSSRKPLRFAHLSIAASFATVVLCGCYVMPVGQDARGKPVYAYSTVPPRASPTQGTAGSTPAGPPPGQPVPQALDIKLYPINDLANQTGVLTGQVTNMMTGKGRFTFNYQGETLVGEATRVANDERRGLASAYGPSGAFARCEYQMSSPLVGAGICTFYNDAMYQVHIGN